MQSNSEFGTGWVQQKPCKQRLGNVWQVVAAVVLAASILFGQTWTVYADDPILAYQETYQDGTNLKRASSITISPDGKHAYVLRAEALSAAIFSRNAATGGLTFLATHQLQIPPNITDPNISVKSLRISPDGNHIYVALDTYVMIPDFFVAYRVTNRVLLYSRDSTSGLLTYISHTHAHDYTFGGPGARYTLQSDVVVSPDGQRVYLTSNYLDGVVVVFDRDVTSGKLTYISTIWPGGSSLNVSPDSQYVTALHDRYDGPISTFKRIDSASGLSLTQTITGDVGTSLINMTTSPDSKHVYLLAYDAIKWFARDATDGTLSVLDSIYGLQFLIKPGSPPEWLAFTADGEYLFVMGSDHVGVFARDKSSGALTPLEVYINGQENAQGLSGATDASISPDGRHLYVVSHRDQGSVTMFTLFDHPANLAHKTYIPALNQYTFCEDIYATPYIWAGSFTWGCDYAQKRVGTMSLRLEAAPDSIVEVYSQLHPVKPNTTYRVSYWVQTDIQVNGAEMYGKVIAAQFNDQARESDEINVHRIDPGFELGENVGGQTEWVQKSYTFTTSGDCAFVRLRAVIGGPSGTASGTVWFDDVQLAEGE